MKVFISSPVPQAVYDALEDYQVVRNDEDRALSDDEIIKGIGDGEVLLCPLSDKINKNIISSCPNLKLITNFGAGFDNIDVDAAKEKGIIVTNAPAPSSTSSTSEITLALILAVSRRLVEGDKNSRAGNFHGWKPVYHLGHEIKGKTLGIYGMGRIGKSVAKKANAFDMDVNYYSRHMLNQKEEKELNVSYTDFDQLIETSDILTFHSAYSPDQHHLINAESFKKMKDSAIVINASRGPIIDEAALAEALENKEIAGAGLDVYEFEPQINEKLKAMDNVVLSPHLGNATWEARNEMGLICVDNINDFKEGKTPRNKIN